MSVSVGEFIKTLESLCGTTFNFPNGNTTKADLEKIFKRKSNKDKFSYRQLNEILLLCNERIVSEEFFYFLAKSNDTIAFKDFKKLVLRFNKLAMLQYGSFRFAFNYLRNKKCKINDQFKNWTQRSNDLIKKFKERQNPIMEIIEIDKDKIHLLGYISGEEKNPETPKTRKIGHQNFNTYLTYDYLDVYVATSMREKIDFIEVHKLCNDVFKKTPLKDLKIRYFDPTQNFHSNSISKGLIEGLMLKRARCTLYLVQQSDTMGKDSEMASTLAQGKPVVAYVPKKTINGVKRELKSYTEIDLIEKAVQIKKVIKNETDLNNFMINLEIFTSYMESKISNNKKINKKEAKAKNYIIDLIAKYEVIFFDKRANTLMYQHPLRFQIDLQSGVANGVLVARNPKMCRKLIYMVLTNTLNFDIFEPGTKISSFEKDDDCVDYRLVEKASRCAFRVVTKDENLTNSF